MLKNRPAAFLCLVFSAGIAAGLFFANGINVIATGLLLLCAFALYRYKKAWVFLTLTALAFTLGYAYLNVFDFFNAPADLDEDTVYCFNAAVREVNEKSSYVYAVGEVQDNSVEFNGRLFCIYLSGNAPKAGDAIKVTAKLSIANANQRSNGIDYVAAGEISAAEGQTPAGFYFRVLKVRQRFGNLIEKALGNECAGFYKALITGDRSGLDTDLVAAFSRSGLSHILSISGQHFSLIVFNAYLLLMRISGRKKLCNVITIILAVAYAVFAGASPSIIRAAFMCGAIFAAELIDERSDPIINLSVVLVILLLFNPYSVINLSLQLSFLSTLGILFTLRYFDPFYEKHGHPRWVRLLIDPAIMSVASTLFCTPIFLAKFDYISLVSPIANVIVNIFIAMAMLCGTVLLPFALLFKGLSMLPLLIYKAIEAISFRFADMRYACVSVYLPYIKLLFVPSLVIVTAFSFLRLKRSIAVFFACFVSALLISAGCLVLQNQGYKDNACLYVDDGVTSSFTFYADESMTVLVDGGGSMGVSEAVLECGHTYVDVYVFTACNKDSVKRFERTVPYTPIHTVFIPEEENDYTQKAIDVAEKHGCNVSRFKNGRLKLADFEIQTADTEFGASSYLINAVKLGKKVTVLGSTRHLYEASPENGDALVLTRSSVEGNFLQSIIDCSYEKVYIYDIQKDIYTDLLIQNGITKQAVKYSGNALFRFGECGVVKE